MIRVVFAVAVCCALLSAGVAIGDDPSKADLEKMQGKWAWLPSMYHLNHPDHEVLTLIHGREVDEKGLLGRDFTLEVKWDSYIFSDYKMETRQATAKLDGNKKPGEIDLVVGQGKPFLGIYTVEGDTLFLFIGDQKQRPSEFPAVFRANRGQVLIQYTREKP